ncbi:cytidine deaminase [bacterium]|nr:cytidine deaminase [bacterium]
MQGLRKLESEIEADILSNMIRLARAAAANSHAPFSHFHVGASVLDDRGRIYTGCNVENIAFGLSMCAERNAAAAAVCGGARRLRAIAVYTAGESLTPPCGACRQVLSDFGPKMEVHLINHEGEHIIYPLDLLLPTGATAEVG